MVDNLKNKVKRIPVKDYWELLFEYFKPYMKKFIILAFFLLSTIVLQLVNPFILRHFVDSSLAGNDLGNLYSLAILFVLVAISTQGLNVLVNYYGESVGWGATNKLRVKLIDHFFKLDVSQRKIYTTGEIIERVDGDVNALQNFFSQFVIKLIGNLLLIVGILIVLFLIDWRIGIGLTTFVIFALFLIERIRSLAVPYFNKVRQLNGHFYGFLTEQLRGSEDIRANGGIQNSIKKFYRYIRNWYPAQKQAEIRGYSMWMTSIAVFTIGNIFSLCIGAYLYSAGSITLGSVFLIFQFTELMLLPIEQIRNQMEDLQRADASILRVKELLNLRSNITNNNDNPFPKGPCKVEFEDVSFSYDGNLPVLQNVNFSIEKNNTLAILGHTGSGKTTITNLLLRFYDPTEGEVYINDVNLKSIQLKRIREKIGVVTQDVHMFDGTLRDNLTFYNKELSDVLLLETIKKMNLSTWLKAFPKGLDTLIERGNMSSGESQIIALIRVFLKIPEIVVLDEASARIDPITERMLKNAIYELLKERTGVIIAHRLETIRDADKIIIMEKGELKEYGHLNSLAKDDTSIFFKLLKEGGIEYNENIQLYL